VPELVPDAALPKAPVWVPAPAGDGCRS